jgi:glutamyl aminopeptidase
MSKVAVPIVYLVGYGAFVVVATLLVGILPPLVNRPACDPSGLPNSRIELPSNSILKKIEPAIHIVRDKRQAEVEPVKNVYEEKQKYFKDNVEPRIKNDPFYKKYFRNKGVNDICPEITNPQPGVTYPWNSTRLPTTLKAYNYALTLYLTDVDREVYVGDNIIRFDVNQPTNYIILHSAENDLPTIQSLKNNLNQDVPITCIGEYVQDKVDYLIIKTDQPLNENNQPYSLDIAFIDFNIRTESGIFKLNYDMNKFMIASKFQPIDARRAYPVFDEPSFKAIYDVTIYHRQDFNVLSNEQVRSFNMTSDIPGVSRTVFQPTEPMPSYFMAYLAFSKDDFDKVGTEIGTPNGPIFVNLWARKQFIQGGFTTDPLNLIEKVLIGVLDIFRNANPICIPNKIDVFAIPDYPVDGIAHQGLPIIKENKILYKNSTASERDKQNVAFLLAKIFSQFWFGNCVTHPWWDQLWLTEGFSDYIKYRAIEEYIGEWNINTEFITEELIPTLILDGYPSSHPIIKPINNAYEIEEFYDEIESSKAAAILRWVETEKTVANFYAAITAYINANTWTVGDINTFYAALGPIGSKNWPAKDFFDRWTLQTNFPLIQVELLPGTGTPQQVRLTQTRSINRNDSIFNGPELYPSPFNFTWYIPTTCEVGVGRTTADPVRIVEFYFDQRTG